jgi:ArsR family transcriptional regulator
MTTSKLALQQLAAHGKVLSDPVRLRLLTLLASQPSLCVCELVSATKLGQSLVSRHLAYLKRHGWVTANRHGAWMHYQLVLPLPLPIETWLDAWQTHPDFAADFSRLSPPVC